MTDMVDLLQAVEALTKPTVEHHAQKKPDGSWWRNHTSTVPALLNRLAAAADPANADGEAPAGASGLSRVPVNLTAIEQHAKIASQIRDWCRIRAVEPTRPPHTSTIEDLQRWHAAVLADNDFDPEWWVRQLRGWAHLIRELLQPAKSFEAHYPCPVCGATSWGDRINGGSMWPIEVRYDLTDDGRMVHERAVCRAGCGTTWVGPEAVRELADEQKEKATQGETA